MKSKIYKIGDVEFKVDLSKKKAVFRDGTKVTWKDNKEKLEDLFDRA